MLLLSQLPDVGPQPEVETEEVIPDPRCGLSPSAVVEFKLAAQLNGRGHGISHMVVCRLASRDRGPAPIPTSWHG